MVTPSTNTWLYVAKDDLEFLSLLPPLPEFSTSMQSHADFMPCWDGQPGKSLALPEQPSPQSQHFVLHPLYCESPSPNHSHGSSLFPGTLAVALLFGTLLLSIFLPEAGWPLHRLPQMGGHSFSVDRIRAWDT